MQSLRQIGAGFLLGVFSVVILLGGFLLAMTEGGFVPAVLPPSPTASSSISIIVTIFPTLLLPVSASTTVTSKPDFTATVSLTPPPTLTICPPPSGWVPVIIQPND